jgi:hypothetical protein
MPTRCALRPQSIDPHAETEALVKVDKMSWIQRILCFLRCPQLRAFLYVLASIGLVLGSWAWAEVSGLDKRCSALERKDAATEERLKAIDDNVRSLVHYLLPPRK